MKSQEKIVVLSGAGISAESGLSTFRDSGGLWETYSIAEVATPEAWEENPQRVLDFYNARRRNACLAQPNEAHRALVELESKFEVIIITQNVDDLHERAGSSQVIHVHGELTKARSTAYPEMIYSIGSKDIHLGDTCERGSQLRPHIVWFGETVQHLDEAVRHIESADKVLVVGTSLSVYPAAGLVAYCQTGAEKVLVALEVDYVPQAFKYYQGKATEHVPHIVKQWLT